MQDRENAAEMSSNIIIQEIRKRIVEAIYKPGEKLREKDICEEFGISRTPVREAFRLLQNEGLLVHLPQRGMQVAEFKEEKIVELLEVRYVLECLSAKNAALYATKEDVDYLRSLNQEMQNFDIKNPQRSFEIDKKFHLYIAHMGKNNYIIELLENLMIRYQMARYFFPFKESRIQYTCKEHEDIISALEANNEVLAEAYMRIHFYQSNNSLRRKIQEYDDKKLRKRKK